MLNEISDKTTKRMGEAMASLDRDLNSISTGRANPSALDVVKAEVYGSLMPLDQLATVSASDSSTLTIQAWDKSNVKAIEKAIINSSLGYNPMVDGQILRISIPKLSQERRQELSKLAKKYGEDKKIIVRNIRRDSIDELKTHEKELGKDTIHGHGEVIQKITDDHIKIIDGKVAQKEKDLMTI